MIILEILALVGQAASSPTLAKSSPRDFYLGCSLQARGQEVKEPRVINEIVANSAARCMLAQVQMLTNFRGSDKDPELRFCPDSSPSFDAKPFDAMSIAYIEFFENNASALATLSGEAAMILALRDKWPCR